MKSVNSLILSAAVLAAVFDRALIVLVEKLERTKTGARKQESEPTRRGRLQKELPERRHETQAVASSRLQEVGATPGCSTRPEAAASGARMPAAARTRWSLSANTGTATLDPTRRSRHIPAAVKREVWARDQGMCRFVGKDGRICGHTGLLEYHHRVPFAVGGETTVDQVSLRCAMHNRYEAEQYFGRRNPAARTGRSDSQPRTLPSRLPGRLEPGTARAAAASRNLQLGPDRARLKGAQPE